MAVLQVSGPAVLGWDNSPASPGDLSSAGGRGSFLSWQMAQLQETVEMYEVFQGPCPEMALFHLCSHVLGQSRLQGQGHCQGVIGALCCFFFFFLKLGNTAK